MQTYSLFKNAEALDRMFQGRKYMDSKHSEKYIRIGLNISLQRKLKKMTQIELAEKIGISRTHMSNIEAPNMVTPVSLEVIFDICDVLDISPEVLFKIS